MKKIFRSRYTPSMMPSEDLEALFVQREPLLQRVVDLIRQSALSGSKHHTLLIGARGIGKTHLISLVYHRIRAMEDLRDKLLIAWAREDEWAITSFLDLLVTILRALNAEYTDAELAKCTELLYGLAPDAAERKAAACLKEFVGGRTLLVIIENLDKVFQGLGDRGQKQLRAFVQENPFWTLLATSQSLFNGISLQTSPFYGFFHIQHLEKLDLEGAVQLLAKIAEHDGDGELASFIRTPTGGARVRVIHYLAGGNHRVYVIFSDVLTRESLDELVKAVMTTLDELTPYYQARMQWLSPQQRKVVDFLCDSRRAVTVKEIAQRCFMTHQTTSGQLKTLREMGYVQSVPVGRESYYELREPLMRLCSEVKKQRGEPIQLLVDFLRHWYLPAELSKWLDLLPPDAAMARDYLRAALREGKAEPKDPVAAALLRDCAQRFEAGEFARALGAASQLVDRRGDSVAYLAEGLCLGELERYEESLLAYNRALEMDDQCAAAWEGRGGVLCILRRWGEALCSFDRLAKLPHSPLSFPWGLRGMALAKLGRHEEALSSLDKAIEIESGTGLLWRERGRMQLLMHRDEEALVSFDNAIKAGEDGALVWIFRSAVLLRLGRGEEASQSLDKGLSLQPNDSQAEGYMLLLEMLGRFDEALSFADRAIKAGCLSPSVFYSRSEHLMALGRWDEGVAALDDALSRFAHTEKPETGDTELMVRILFERSPKQDDWAGRIADLARLYGKHKSLPSLGQGLVRNIRRLFSPMVSDAAARKWRDDWQHAAGGHPEMAIPLRLLDAAVRYREAPDERVLLELPAEERNILRDLLPKENKVAAKES